MKPKRCTVHKYRLHNYGVRAPRYLYGCLHCTHYLTHIDNVIGKESLCNRCGEPFIVTTSLTHGKGSEGKPNRRVKLICPKCATRHKIQKIDEAFMRELGI